MGGLNSYQLFEMFIVCTSNFKLLMAEDGICVEKK